MITLPVVGYKQNERNLRYLPFEPPLERALAPLAQQYVQAARGGLHLGREKKERAIHLCGDRAANRI